MAARLAFAACFALAGLLLLAPGAQAAGDFVTVNAAGTGFATASCPDFVFSAYNTWQPIEAAAGLLGPGAAIEPQFDLAAENGLSVIRMFGFAVQQGINNQYAPGSYNESMLVAFDRVIAAASERNLKLIIALANNWDYNGNMSDNKCWYANQSATATGCDDFFTNPEVRQFYLDNARAILTRVNTVTRLAYNNDPTIMAWNLINEGRCEANCTAADIQAWTAAVAPEVKRLAPRQLVTIGQDGFWQEDNCASNDINPVPNTDGWPLRTGQDFVANHAVDGIDYTSIHMWPDNWARTDLDFGKAWINAHLAHSRILGKPLVLEEFGKAVGGSIAGSQTVQDQVGYYSLAYAIAEGSINSGDALRGIGFWRWDSVDPQAQLTGFDQQATITTSGPVFTNIIRPFSDRISRRCPSNSGAGGATASAGRKLRQTGVPGTSATNTAAPIASAPAVAAQPGGNANALITGSACEVNLTVPGGGR